MMDGDNEEQILKVAKNVKQIKKCKTELKR